MQPVVLCPPGEGDPGGAGDAVFLAAASSPGPLAERLNKNAAKLRESADRHHRERITTTTKETSR
ncbi:hypothetical protein [Streptomyces sioyaensis]|uniref:hypothetical protein n=1 Tax=Streptomyces sioyaensis TaxID=67364 RepID=UPI0037ADBE57